MLMVVAVRVLMGRRAALRVGATVRIVDGKLLEESGATEVNGQLRSNWSVLDGYQSSTTNLFIHRGQRPIVSVLLTCTLPGLCIHVGDPIV